MKRMTLLRPVILLALSTLTACLTNNTPASLDVTALQAEAVEKAKVKFCLSQTPQKLGHIAWTDEAGNLMIGVTDDQYRAAPTWVKSYIVGNDAQFREMCPAE